MASPVVEEAIESATPTTAATSHTCTLPTATAGQLLLIIADKGSTAATITDDGGLTELLDENSANGLYIAYRQMDGTEPASITLTTSASTRLVEIAYRISGAENPSTQAPEIGTTGTGTSATPDPPASATPGSTKDYLFIAFYGAAGEEANDDTWSDTPPTNYTPSPPRQITCGTVGTNLGGLLAAAERQLTTGSAEDPGTFAKDVSAAWRSQTILVHPASQQVTPGLINQTGATFSPEVQLAITQVEPGLINQTAVAFVPDFARPVLSEIGRYGQFVDEAGLRVHGGTWNEIGQDYNPFLPTAGTQTVSPGLIDQTAVAFAPQVNQSVTATFVDQTGVTFAPQVNQRVDLGLIDRTGATFDPTVSQEGGAQTVSPGLISSTGTTFAPQVNWQLALGLIDRTGATFDPVVLQAQQVEVPLITNLGTLFVPTFIQPQMVTVGLISQMGVLFAPVVTTAGMGTPIANPKAVLNPAQGKATLELAQGKTVLTGVDG